ncbi:hypothetical protein BBK82_03120 [Lentzea guizhouensis]|uniref:Uncharacterized protein n=1 Tax=Lentzea guizhouensis TaxID=1586287 RepID=A0A1B2HBV6_9PSEU|nr:DUF6221 family protein [Lentzea guizhouensis]ANZ35208.1 hypothetical protein BBK82_03120 [Lentzea guizhouensis]
MTLSDLVELVLAAIEETEHCALAVQEGRRQWRVGEVGFEGYAVVDSKGGRVLRSDQLGVDHHIARNDPATTLRRCAADRKLLARGGPFCDCDERRQPTNPTTGLPIPHHYDCSAYEAAAVLAESYGIDTDIQI